MWCVTLCVCVHVCVCVCVCTCVCVCMCVCVCDCVHSCIYSVSGGWVAPQALMFVIMFDDKFVYVVCFEFDVGCF